MAAPQGKPTGSRPILSGNFYEALAPLPGGTGYASDLPFGVFRLEQFLLFSSNHKRFSKAGELSLGLV